MVTERFLHPSAAFKRPVSGFVDKMASEQRVSVDTRISRVTSFQTVLAMAANHTGPALETPWHFVVKSLT